MSNMMTEEEVRRYRDSIAALIKTPINPTWRTVSLIRLETLNTVLKEKENAGLE